MTWYPTAFIPTQIEDSAGAPRNGAVLKAYAAGTNTPIPMATDYTGLTTAASFPINSLGYPTYQGTIIIPHLQENYKMALYPDQASADANSGAVWTIDNNQIALSTNSPFTQYFDGDGVNNVFTLSQDFGTDPKVLLVFADRAIVNYASNTDFATDTIWTKGAGWTISGGVANATGALNTPISQVAVTPIIQGQSYTVEFTVTALAGTVTPSVGGNAGTTRGAGTWRETIVAGSTQVLAFTGVGFTGTLDNAPIRATAGGTRVINRADEMTLNGNQLTLQNIPTAGTKNVIVFAPSSLIGAAQASAAAAALSEANALIYKNQAQVYATALNGTSTTSVSIATGSKSFTTQADKQFFVGNWLTISSAGNINNYMFGQVTAYNSTTGALTVNVTEIAGVVGPFADWNVSISGIKGVNGTIPDGSITRQKIAIGAVAAENLTSSKTANYTATSDDDFIPCNATSAGFTITLPPAATVSGRELTIKKTDASFNIVTIDANGSETIDGALTRRLCTQNETIILTCDGSNWYIKSRDIPSIWTTYTPTLTHDSGGITNITNTARYRRIGDSIEVMYSGLFSAASAAFSGLYLSVPSGLTIDLAKMPTTTNFALTVGNVQTLDVGVQSYPGLAVYAGSSGTITLLVQGAAGAYANGQLITNTIPFTFGNGDLITARFVVPITNWEG